ncbi:MAG TPA: methyltransferase domain-containing protein [Mycobacteriales bacterium]|nr:methyltransferase domain-containing protein [Mycobacteriales bacterium]
MTSRSNQWRDWLAAAPLPGRGAGRGGTSRQGGLVFRNPVPQPSPAKRDPAGALGFVDRPTASDAPEPTDLAERVASVGWYHTIKLPGGIVTPGQFDHSELLPHYGLPESLAGKRAIDVATFDGYWAFEMERRGADVTAIDLDDSADLDFPTLVKQRLADFGPMPRMGKGFAIAHDALGSKVRRVGTSVYSLDPDRHGTFDFAHCGDLLLHLRDPLTALERIRAVTTGQLLLCDVVDPDARPSRFGPTLSYRGGWNDVTWWVPSLEAMAQMVIDAGFASVHVNCVYQLAKTIESGGYWRASITATV